MKKYRRLYNSCIIFILVLRNWAIELNVYYPATSVKPPPIQPFRDLNRYFPFKVPDSIEEWTWRKNYLKQRLLTVLGLWPSLPRLPLNPQIYGKIDMEDYTIEKVYFESLPGFYVTGNLYRPKNGKPPYPGVLCPHGHWDGGRFYDAGAKTVAMEIIEGAELYSEGGRNPIQARCVHLARMGYVVFNYDMIGYADSIQIPASVAHGFRKQRPEMNHPERWGFFSPQAELWYQSIMGLQSWNSIRALDFLESLPEVDRNRIGVTGASGGGTQTFILCAIDHRPAVAFPAVMVSTEMQGGCTCENCCGLRIDTGNVEIAALFAPKPLGMTAANDWTARMLTHGFPELKRLYGMYGAMEKVELFPYLQFTHNYNAISRAAMYSWFQRWLKPGEKVPIERDYQRLTSKELSVWDEAHPAPTSGPEVERNICAWWRKQSEEALLKTWKDSNEFFETYRKGWEVIIGRNWRQSGLVTWTQLKVVKIDNTNIEVGLLRNETYAEEIPAVIVKRQIKPAGVAIMITLRGKEGILNRECTALNDLASAIVDKNYWIISADLYEQGERRSGPGRLEKAKLVPNGREALSYTYGYNHSPFAKRVHDVLSLVLWAKSIGGSTTKLALIGYEGGGKWAGGAAALLGGVIDVLLIDTEGFRFATIDDIYDPDLLPGGWKFGDIIGGIAAGIAPITIISGETQLPPLIKVATTLKKPTPVVKLVPRLSPEVVELIN